VDEALSHHHHVGGSLSRTAAERNNVHLREALRTALTRYPDASEEARRAVALRLARCCRQLGFDHYRAGDYARAAEHFAEARALRPNRRDTWYLIESTVRSKLGFRHRRRPRVESGPAGAMLGAGVVGGTPPTARN